jgi:phosphate transport system substrate-binding protein
MEQLDGIFGAQRTGGWRGSLWSPEAARGAHENIRTWGQLGLSGEWARQTNQYLGLRSVGHERIF